MSKTKEMQNPVQNKKLTVKKWAEKLFLLIFGIAFLIYGLMIPALTLAGTKTTGTITTVRRENGEMNQPIPNRYRYSVGFEFTTSSGKNIPGNTKVIGSPYNSGISKGPATVMYFKFFPYLNALEESSFFPIERIIILAVGILFLVLALKKTKQRGRKKRQNKQQSKQQNKQQNDQ